MKINEQNKKEILQNNFLIPLSFVEKSKKLKSPSCFILRDWLCDYFFTNEINLKEGLILDVSDLIKQASIPKSTIYKTLKELELADIIYIHEVRNQLKVLFLNTESTSDFIHNLKVGKIKISFDYQVKIVSKKD